MLLVATVSTLVVRGTIKVINQSPSKTESENYVFSNKVNTVDNFINTENTPKEIKTIEEPEIELSENDENAFSEKKDNQYNQELDSSSTLSEYISSNEKKVPVKEKDSKQSSTTFQITEQKTQWEKLNITEDQYYNSPMYSWEKVDFKTIEECTNYGDNYIPYINGEVLYNCHDVFSIAGRHLGVMFITEKLN